METGKAVIEVNSRARTPLWKIADAAIADLRFKVVAASTIAILTDVFVKQEGGALLYVLLTLWATERFGRKIGNGVAGIALGCHLVIDLLQHDLSPFALLLQAVVSFLVVSRCATQRERIDHLVKAANQDALTGCATRRTLEHFATEQISRSAARNVPFTLAVLDCDKFKALNDRHGHAFGDQILKTLTECVRHQFGNQCMLGRTGGDEFVLAAVGMERYDVEIALDKALKKFGDATLVRGAGRCTFSYGLAEAYEGVYDYKACLEVADEDLYRRKAEKHAPSLFGISA